MKNYLKKYDRAFSTGVYLVWDGEKFVTDGFEDDTYFDGDLVNWDEYGKPYVEDI